MWTNTSLPPSAGAIKPKPLVELNHFTVPLAMGSLLSSAARVSAAVAAWSVWIEKLTAGLEETGIEKE
jgi:hypothetical protein